MARSARALPPCPLQTALPLGSRNGHSLPASRASPLPVASATHTTPPPGRPEAPWGSCSSRRGALTGPGRCRHPCDTAQGRLEAGSTCFATLAAAPPSPAAAPKLPPPPPCPSPLRAVPLGRQDLHLRAVQNSLHGPWTAHQQGAAGVAAGAGGVAPAPLAAHACGWRARSSSPIAGATMPERSLAPRNG